MDRSDIDQEEPRIDFLNLDGCSEDEIQTLESLLHNVPIPSKAPPPQQQPPPQVVPQAPVPAAFPPASSSYYPPPPNVSHGMSAPVVSAPLNGHPPYLLPIDPNAASHAAAAAPYLAAPMNAYPSSVYIDKLTANVSVHHSGPPAGMPDTPGGHPNASAAATSTYIPPFPGAAPPMYQFSPYMVPHPAQLVAFPIPPVSGPPPPNMHHHPNVQTHYQPPLSQYQPQPAHHPPQPFPQQQQQHPPPPPPQAQPVPMAPPVVDAPPAVPENHVQQAQQAPAYIAPPEAPVEQTVIQVEEEEPLLPAPAQDEVLLHHHSQMEPPQPQVEVQHIPEEQHEPEPQPQVYQDETTEPPVTDNVDVHEEPAAELETAVAPQEEVLPAAPKSWASLFHGGKRAENEHSYQAKPMAKITPFTNEETTSPFGMQNEEEMGASGAVGGDRPLENRNKELLMYLRNYELNHKSPSLKPRGLSNRSNWCFVNAILQALVACPPFFNFMKFLPFSDKDMTTDYPILRSVWEFVKDIETMINFPKLNRRDKGKKNEDLPLTKTFEAASVYNMLLELNTDTFKVVEGRQEDAEEFLTFLLNGLSDDVTAVFKTDETEEKVEEDVQEEDDNEEEWKEVGRNNKSCITRKQDSDKTPLSSMFQGQIRSCVQHSAGEPTATLQPFFTLQLDIQSASVGSVGEALSSNFATERLDGYIDAATKQEVEASRSLSLEDLPPVLILHMKRFLYDTSSGGSQKLSKTIDFPVDLEIPREILSPASKGKFPGKQRQYKLFGVVYHNGSEATKGHYVTDVYHTGLATWLRCDDSSVRSVTEGAVLSHATNSVPYILFYRRGDTMMGKG